MLFIQPSEKNVALALEAWQWLPIQDKKPDSVTAFDDLFFTGKDGVWFLDVLGGTLSNVCESKDKLADILKSEEGQSHYLFAGFVERAFGEGNQLGAGEYCDFEINPVVGGTVEYDNVVRRNFVVAANMAGQLYEQVQALPDGASITGFTVEEYPE